MEQGSCINDVKVKGKNLSKTGKVSSFLARFSLSSVFHKKQITMGNAAHNHQRDVLASAI
jgi:hypothetical protein